MSGFGRLGWKFLILFWKEVIEGWISGGDWNWVDVGGIWEEERIGFVDR